MKSKFDLNDRSACFFLQGRYRYPESEKFHTYTSGALTSDTIKNSVLAFEKLCADRQQSVEFLKIYQCNDAFADLTWENILADRDIPFGKKIETFRKKVVKLTTKVLFETEDHYLFRQTAMKNFLGSLTPDENSKLAKPLLAEINGD